MFRTIGHQTLKNKNNVKYVENNGPFSVEDVSSSFLGAGHYFWDNHIDLAHWWGKRHCKGKYYICQCEIEVDEFYFLDIVGNRQDQINLKELIEKLNIDHLTIGEIMEVLKEIQKEEPTSNIFPYKAIRAIDYDNKPSFYQNLYMFKKNNNSYSILAPIYIICLLEKNELILPPYKVIFSV
jgi:hypothetical protein